MDNVQAGILAPPPRLARFLTFSLKSGAASRQSLQALGENADGNKVVVGVGYPLVLALERHIDGLRTFPSYFGSGSSFRQPRRRFGAGCVEVIAVNCCMHPEE